MTKTAPSRPTLPVGRLPVVHPSKGAPTRWISADEAFEGAVDIASRLLPGFVRTMPDGSAEWLRSEVLLPLGIDFLNRASSPKSEIPSQDLVTWATAVGLDRWARDFTEAIRPILGALIEYRLSLGTLPPWPVSERAGPSSRAYREVNRRVAVEIEALEFRLEEFLPPPDPVQRSDWVQSVLRYGGWDRTDGAYVPQYFVPRFIDKAGRIWNVPEHPDRSWDALVEGWLSRLRFPPVHADGPRNRDQARRIAAMLSETPRPTYEAIRYLLEKEGFQRPPSLRTIGRIARRLRAANR